MRWMGGWIGSPQPGLFMAAMHRPGLTLRALPCCLGDTCSPYFAAFGPVKFVLSSHMFEAKVSET